MGLWDSCAITGPQVGQYVCLDCTVNEMGCHIGCLWALALAGVLFTEVWRGDYGSRGEG